MGGGVLVADTRMERSSLGHRRSRAASRKVPALTSVNLLGTWLMFR
jgi:hypothetical protein